MTEFVKIEKLVLEELINAAVDACNLLDNVHCYDCEEYEKLCDILNEIEYEDIK